MDITDSFGDRHSMLLEGKSLELDSEAVATLRGKQSVSESRERLGFAKLWADAVTEQVKDLKAQDFDFVWSSRALCSGVHKRTKKRYQISTWCVRLI